MTVINRAVGVASPERRSGHRGLRPHGARKKASRTSSARNEVAGEARLIFVHPERGDKREGLRPPGAESRERKKLVPVCPERGDKREGLRLPGTESRESKSLLVVSLLAVSLSSGPRVERGDLSRRSLLAVSRSNGAEPEAGRRKGAMPRPRNWLCFRKLGLFGKNAPRRTPLPAR